MDDFDFLKAFSGVDVLAVEAVAEVVGHVHAALIKGMTDRGLDEDVALKVVQSAHKEFFDSFLRMMNRNGDG